MDQNDILSFIHRQTANADFPCTDLSTVERRELPLSGATALAVQYNPARIRSSAAKIDTRSLAARPCFLCPAQRPASQLSLPDGEDYEILVNPYPILPDHLTIVARWHQPQRFAVLRDELCRLAELMPDFIVFYNGPHSGASAPDHAHLQAGRRGLIPIERDWKRLRLTDAYIGEGIYRVMGFAAPAYAVTAPDACGLSERLASLMQQLPVKEGCEEPDVNVLAWREGDGLVGVVFHRRAHRPACYFAEGAARRLVSPGAVDMGGLLITPEEASFSALTPEEAADILREVTEPHSVSVGLACDLNQFSLTLHTPYRLHGELLPAGDYEVRRTSEGIVLDGKAYTSLSLLPTSADSSFTLHALRFGHDFHWQREEDQRFLGALRYRDGDIVNELPIEDYLRSVIASEMKATAHLELLKAHAVISRSWLLRQMYPALQGEERDGEWDGESDYVTWYDSRGHTNFHVCADDHCQRYQGISRITSPNVARAVEETAGLVLYYDGAICDARFSKCCGGQTELFSTCWEDRDYDYLPSIADADAEGDFCDTDDEELLAQVLNDYDLETRDFYRWTVEYSVEELSQLVAEKSHFNLGRILDLRPLRRGPGGRISLLEIVGERRSVRVGKELEIRRLLSPSHLKSAAFEVEKTPQGFRLSGRGWGHGVGLCQIGAARMAAKGYGFRDILAHYYRGAILKKLY